MKKHKHVTSDKSDAGKESEAEDTPKPSAAERNGVVLPDKRLDAFPKVSREGESLVTFSAAKASHARRKVDGETEAFLGDLKRTDDAAVKEALFEPKKRKRKLKQRARKPEWEANEGKIPEEQTTSSKQWSIVVGSEVSNEGRVKQQRARITKRRILKIPHALRHSSRLIWILCSAILACILAVSIPSVRDGIRKQLPFSGQIESGNPREALVRRDDAKAVLSHFLASETWRDQLDWVRAPDRVAPIMEGYYATHTLNPAEVLEIKAHTHRQIAGRSVTYLAAEIRRKGKANTANLAYFALEDTGGSFLVDWETAVNYAPVTLADFQSSATPGATTWFRVTLTPSDYYNGHFSSESKWVAYELTYPRSNFLLYGYVARNGDLALQLAGLKTSGEPQNIIVSVRYQGSLQASYATSQVEITEVLESDWIY